MKAIVKAVQQERKALLRQLKLVESTLAKFGSASTGRKKRKYTRKAKVAAKAAAPVKRGRKPVVKDNPAEIEQRRERARAARQEPTPARL
jgi:hypothetical protein